MGWKPIGEAPKDGTPLLLRGGKADDGSGETACTPVVCGFWLKMENLAFDLELDYWVFKEGRWVFAHWDSDWRSEYVNPTEFMFIPDL